MIRDLDILLYINKCKHDFMNQFYEIELGLKSNSYYYIIYII